MKQFMQDNLRVGNDVIDEEDVDLIGGNGGQMRGR
jgi:hypothetical protein